MIEEEPSIPSNEKDTSESILDSIMSTDKELKRLLHEKEMLLSRLLNLPQEQINDNPGNVRISNPYLIIYCIFFSP
jgi:hypothetical protein